MSSSGALRDGWITSTPPVFLVQQLIYIYTFIYTQRTKRPETRDQRVRCRHQHNYRYPAVYSMFMFTICYVHSTTNELGFSLTILFKVYIHIHGHIELREWNGEWFGVKVKASCIEENKTKTKKKTKKKFKHKRVWTRVNSKDSLCRLKLATSCTLYLFGSCICE